MITNAATTAIMLGLIAFADLDTATGWAQIAVGVIGCIITAHKHAKGAQI